MTLVLLYQGYTKNDEYIITQHPMKSTVADFWRMVWDKNSMTLVLLSDTDEEVTLYNLFVLCHKKIKRY